jgi:nitrogen fixation protein FixH
MTANQIHNPPTQAIDENEAFHRFLWTSGIIGLFCVQGIIWIIAISMTSRDSSHAVLPDYERRSLSWDQHQQRIRASAALGWTCEASFLAGINEKTDLVIQLKDKSGSQLHGALMTGTAFHCARAADVKSLFFDETEPGIYQASLGASATGIWQIAIEARLGESVFIYESRIETASTGGRR